MHGVNGRRNKIEMLIEATRAFILGVNGESAYARNIGSLQGALDCVSQKCLANSLPLSAAVDGQTRKQHDRYRVPGQALLEALGSLLQGNVTDSEHVVTNNNTVC